jgi:hypothetical protein
MNISFDQLIPGLKQYAVSMSPDIKKLINENLEWEDTSRFRPADFAHIERNMTIDDVLQPYQADIRATKSNTTFSGVETHLEDGMILTKFEQKDLDQFTDTQMYQYRELGKTVTEQALYGMIMNQLILPKVKENLNTVAFKGVRVEPTTGQSAPMLTTFTGFNKRFSNAIDGHFVTPFATGPITPNNIVSSVILGCESIPSWLRYKKGKVKMSKTNVQRFINKQIADNHYTYTPTNDQGAYMMVPGYNKDLVGLDSMEGSNRIIIELDEFPAMNIPTRRNMPILPTLRVHQFDMFTMHVYAPMTRAFGLTQYEVLFVNDQN